jgi:hypothetical protein
MDPLIQSLVVEGLPKAAGTIFLAFLLGSLLGALVSAGTCWLLLRLGVYRLPASNVGVGILFTVSILLGLLCGGYAGMRGGVLRGVTRVGGESQVVERLLPHIGRSGALLLAAVSCLGESGFDAKALPARLDAFQRGAWALDVSTLPERVSRLTPARVATATNAVKSAMAVLPQMESPVARNLVNNILGAMAAQLLPHAGVPIRDRAIMRFAAHVIDDLPAHVAGGGDGRTISCRNLSIFIGRESLTPFVYEPLLHTVRLNQLYSALILLAWFALSVLGTRVFVRKLA